MLDDDDDGAGHNDNSNDANSVGNNDDDDDDHHDDDAAESDNDEDDEMGSEPIAALINAPADTTAYVDEANHLLASFGLLQRDSDGSSLEVPLGSAVERELYRLFDSNEPFSRTQLLDHPRIKSNSAQFKKKQLEDALQALIDNNIVIAQNLAGGKTQIFYLNQAHRPTLAPRTSLDGQQTDPMAQLRTKMDSLTRTLQINKVTLQALNSEVQSMKSAVKTDELQQTVHQLRQELVRRQQRLELLKTVSADPTYIQTLKLTYTKTVNEWKKRKRVLKEMTQPYLETVQKKQRVFLRELGCESEEVELGISLDEFIAYGQKQRIFDAQGKPLLSITANGPSPTNLINPNPIAQQQQLSSSSKQKDMFAGLVVRAGENRAQKIAEMYNKPPSPPPKTSRGAMTAAPQINQRVQLVIPKLVFKSPLMNATSSGSQQPPSAAASKTSSLKKPKK